MAVRSWQRQCARCLARPIRPLGVVRRTLRPYHSYEHDPPPPFASTQEAILSASMRRVPEHGFTETALALGVKDAGYLDVSVNLFPHRAFDLINYHLVSQRLALKRRVQFGEPDKGPQSGSQLGIGARVRMLTTERLLANRPIIHRWQEALAVMAQPSHVGTSIAELARLSDEIWFLAGDTSVDTSWYTKRASLSAIYSSTELFMTQDTPPDFVETQEFLDRRLQDVRSLGEGVSNLGDWLEFTGHAVTNVLRSKGVRI